MADEAQEPIGETDEPQEQVTAIEPAEPAEVEPFNEGALAAELYREERETRTRWIVGGVGAILCAAIGGGIVLAVLYLNPGLRPPRTSTIVAKNDLPPVKPYVPNIATYHPDATPPVIATDPGKTPEKPTDKTQETNPPPAAPAGPPKQMPPFDPFAGGPVPKGWQKGKGPLTGNIAVSPDGAKATATTNPATDSSPTTATQTKAEATLITGRAGGGDAEGDAQDIVRALESAGASVRFANHYGSSGGIAGVQIVASVPMGALDEAKNHLEGAGVSVGDAWKGELPERTSRIGAIISERISDLRKAKSALLVKYLDDAPEVVQVDEEIQKLTQCLGMARINGRSPKVAIIVVGVGAL